MTTMSSMLRKYLTWLMEKAKEKRAASLLTSAVCLFITIIFLVWNPEIEPFWAKSLLSIFWMMTTFKIFSGYGYAKAAFDLSKDILSFDPEAKKGDTEQNS